MKDGKKKGYRFPKGLDDGPFGAARLSGPGDGSSGARW